MTTKVTQDVLLSTIDEAEEHIADAIDCLLWVAENSDSSSFRTRLVASLEVMLGTGGWITRDPTLDEWRQSITAEFAVLIAAEDA